MSAVITWITANTGLLVGVLGGVALLLTAISKLTKTKKDDKVAGWFTVAYNWARGRFGSPNSDSEATGESVPDELMTERTRLDD